MPKKKSEPAKAPEVAPEVAVAGPQFYRATSFSTVPAGDGEKLVNPGDIVVADADAIDAYPEERFAEAFPDVDVSSIPEQE